MPQDEDGMLGIMKMCVLKMERNYAKFTPLHNSKGHNLESYAKFMLSSCLSMGSPEPHAKFMF